MNENEVLQKMVDNVQTQTEEAEKMLHEMDKINSRLRSMNEASGADDLSEIIPQAQEMKKTIDDHREHVEENRQIMEELRAAISAKHEG